MGLEYRTLTDDTASEIAQWCGGRLVKEIDPFDETVTYTALNVPTRNGVERARVGDAVVQSHDGTFSIHIYTGKEKL